MDIPARYYPRLLLCLVPWSVVLLAAQTPQQPQTPAPQSQGAAPLPSPWADALKLGEALELQATPELKKWLKEFAKKEMRKRPMDVKDLMTAVDQHLPQAYGDERGAITYLLFYTAYKDELGRMKEPAPKNEKPRVSQAKVPANVPNPMPNGAYSPEPQVSREYEDTWNKKGSADPRGSANPSTAANDSAKRRLEFESAREKSYHYLAILTQAYRHMQKVDPAVIRQLK